MKDEKRITEILGLIQEIWEKDKDMRFFQMIYVLQSKFSKEKGDIGQIKFKENDGYSQIGFDLFGTEDEELIKFLKEFS